MRCLWLMLSPILALPIAAWGQAPAFPVGDINTRPYVLSSYPRDFMTVGTTTFFIAQETSAPELWKTDGSPEGTSRIAPVKWPAALVAGVDGRLFFTAGTDDGFALWTSDGTAAGTMPIKEVPYQSFDRCNVGSAVVGGRLYFATCVDRDSGNYTLWTSDGTDAGTLPLTSLGPYPYWPNFTDVNGTLFFLKGEEATGIELWKSDGSAEGTVLVKDIYPGVESSYPRLLGAVGDALIFTAFDGTDWGLWRSDGSSAGTFHFSDVQAWESFALAIDGNLYFAGDTVDDRLFSPGLWKTDGTSTGTVRLKPDGAPMTFINSDGTVFFVSWPAQLWKSDGTEPGTVLVADLTAASEDGSIELLTAVDGILYFRVRGSTAEQLWSSDGTTTGTRFLTNMVEPGATYTPSQFAVGGGTFFFTVTEPVDPIGHVDVDLWKSDGTPSGTVAVMDLDPNDQYVWPFDVGDWLVAGEGAVFFAANSHQSGVEPWASDGTPEGTLQVANIRSDEGTTSASPMPIGVVGGALLFSADDGYSGRELWRTDGSAMGTVLVKDIDPGLGSGFADGAHAIVNDVLYFYGYDPDAGWELRRSDGTAAGTTLLKEICPGLCSAGMSWLTAVGDSIFFATFDETSGNGLWKSDGTAEGTVQVVANRFSWSMMPTALGTEVFFAVENQLWKSDGTAAGTVQLRDLGAYPQSMAVVNDLLFIVTQELIYGDDGRFEGSRLDLWTSDGTSAGTTLVESIHTEGFRSAVTARDLQAASGRLYFVIYHYGWGYSYPVALWSSDGTADGTAALTAIGGYSSYRSAVVDDTLYFSIFDEWDRTVGLYRVDGTATALVKQVFADEMRDVGGRLVFSACDPPRGCEVWESDGTAAGTRAVADVNPGPSSSAPSLFAVAEPFVFFAAQTGPSMDSELWAMPLADLGQCGNGSLDAGETCDTGGESAACDADCTAPECGDAVVNASAGEVCDDGAALRCCSATCTLQPSGTACANFTVCDGAETCDGAGTCMPGTALVCDDGDEHTTDWCDSYSGCQSQAIPVCTGDCNDDRAVSVDELVRMVERAMGRFPAPECLSADPDADGHVRIEEIVAAVRNALYGCPVEPGQEALTTKTPSHQEDRFFFLVSLRLGGEHSECNPRLTT